MLSKIKVPRLPKPGFTPLSVFFLSVFPAFTYVLMEWVFIVTKPSFLHQAPFGDQVSVLFISAALLTGISLIFLLPFIISYKAAPKSQITSALRLTSLLMPALILSCLVLIMADNFTYTVFKFGIVSAKGGFQAIYTVLFVLLAWFLFIKLISAANFITEVIERRSVRGARRTAGVMLLLTLLLILVPVLLSVSRNKSSFVHLGANRREKLPNILLITADSLNASATSLFGSEDRTTPFLEELAKTSLVAENAFSNAQGTIGSLTSILTGRDPLDTRVIESDDFLSDTAAVQHLPAILKANGYYTVQLSYSYYADAVRINFQDGFNEANGKMTDEASLTHWLSILLPEKTAIFIREVSTRLWDRVAHIFFIQEMRNPYQEVTVAATKLTDLQKLERVRELFAAQDKPLFIHVHWMTTHGPTYQVSKQVFSTGKDPQNQEKYDNDFYRDAILDFDQAVSDLFADLNRAGTLDNTILVISADHSQRWTVSRLPLIMHFPGGEHAGVLRENVEYLDITPTLLDAVDLPQPDWMPGSSLLNPVDPDRTIFLASINSSTRNKVTGKVEFPKPEPPFYQFGKIWVLRCNQYFLLNLQNRQMSYGKVTSYAGVCPNEEFLQSDALALIMKHMQRYGFDTSSLNQ